MIEDDFARCFALINRRINILEKLFKELSHSVYNNYIMEISSELSEIYLEWHDTRVAQVQTGKAQMSKDWLKEQNRIAKECIKYS